MTMTKRFLVTGGAGFIGSNLCEKLLESGHSVRVLDNLSTGKESNLEGLLDPVEFIHGDVRNREDVEKAVDGVDYVVHLAALGSVPRSVADPETTHEVNATGTLRVLTAAKDGGVKRVVYASSSSVYGDTPVLPKKIDMIPNPQSPYAVSKIAGEYYCRVFHRVYGLETVALRYFNVYGKRQDPTSQYAAVIPKFVAAILRGDNPVIFGDGEQSRDFTFVDDCNQANIKACFAGDSAGRYFNVGTGERITINTLAEKIGSALRKDVIPDHREARKGDVKHSLADITETRESLGYAPDYNIDSGLERTVSWYVRTNR